MAIMPRSIAAVTFLLLSAFSAFGQSFSPSAQGSHSNIRLLAGGQTGAQWLAGIEIALDPGFKTYWRNPGESGLPPQFDWSGSENVEALDIRWPAPSRYEDAAGVAYTYSGTVILPVVVTPKEPGKPVKLRLSADYGICKDICIPARADLNATLSGKGLDRTVLEEALAKVPHPQALGEQAELSVLSVEPLENAKPSFSVTVRAPSGTEPVLFAEGAEDWYVSTSAPDGSNRFTVTVEERPKESTGPIPLRLTLVAGERAIETRVSLDEAGQPR